MSDKDDDDFHNPTKDIKEEYFSNINNYNIN